MKTIFLGTNLKMFKGYKETIEYVKAIDAISSNISSTTQLFIIPSFPTIKESIEVCKSGRLWIGSQNMNENKFGALTGEVSPVLLKEIGVVINELGHSERRQLFGETDKALAEKMRTSIELNMSPLLCVGETSFEKDSGASFTSVSRQLEIGISNIKIENAANVLVAYEPVWAIGENGTPAEPKYVEEIHFQLRKVLITKFGDIGNQIPILYGGSVNLQNYQELLSLTNVDGLFIGRTAWDILKFREIIQYVDKNQKLFL